jgi:Skp family chaperone for outer membrane proteins
MESMAQKVGYVATDLIRSKYEANEQAEQRLEAQVNEWKAELAQAQRDIEDLELELKKNRLIWSDAERQSREKQLDEKRRERDKLARQRFEPGGEYDRISEQLFKGVWSKIYLAVQKVAAAEGYDMVWDKSTQPLVYVNAKFDLTVKVMQELGIEASDLDKKQKDAIANDPRNKKLEEPRRRRSRSALPDAKQEPDKPNEQVKTEDGNMWINPDGTRIPKQDVGPTPIDTTFRPTPRETEVPR